MGCLDVTRVVALYLRRIDGLRYGLCLTEQPTSEAKCRKLLHRGTLQFSFCNVFLQKAYSRVLAVYERVAR